MRKFTIFGRTLGEIPLKLPEHKPETAEKPEENSDKKSISDIPHNHKNYLEALILNDFKAIYIGDRVKVSDRWAGRTKNPHEGREGIIINIEAGIQAAFNVDYLIYRVKEDDGREFETYYYALDLLHQQKKNKSLAEELNEIVIKNGLKKYYSEIKQKYFHK